jgi:hypothetical protein
MVALMMLNLTKNQTIWYGAKMPGRTWWIKHVAVCTSWVQLWCPHTGCARRPWVTLHFLEWQESNKNEWLYENIIFKKWICKFEKNEYQVPASCYVVPRIWFSSQRSYSQIDSLRWKTRGTIYPL